MNKEQMELGFNGTVAGRPVKRRARGLVRAQWWFRQMRRVVDQALDWRPIPTVRPEQGYLTLARRR